MSSRIPKMEVTIDNVRFKEVPDKRQGVKIGSILTLSNVKMSESVADYINNPDDRFYTLVNAVDIDWNAVVVDNNLELHTTSDLIKWIKSLAGGGIDPSNYYDKAEIDAKVTELNQADTDINNAIGTDSTPNTIKGRIKSIEDSYVSDNDLSDYTYDKNTIDEKVAQGGTFDPEQYYNKQATDQLLSAKADSNNLADVATSGSYNDLTNKPTIPTIPTNVSAFTNDAGYLTQHQDISGKANTADLSTVATTGSYNDLSNKPSIPSELVQADWNETTTSSKAFIKNKPNIPTVPTNVSAFTNDAGYLTLHLDISGKADKNTLATVATSGSYTDLTDKPTIPGAQIQADWNLTTTTAKDYIKNKPTVPTKTSELVNDSSFITSSDIPEGAAASNTMPKEDGNASTGSELAFARGDHRHPHDSTKADISSLANVATSGSYNDLNDKPSIPDALIQSDWGQNITTAKDYIKNKPNLAAVATSGSFTDLTNKPTYTKNDVGLGNVLNVEQIPATDKGVAGGVATLDSTGKVPSSQLPSYVDDVIEAASRSAFPATGETDKIYVAKDTNKEYRWGGSDYVVISETLAIGETSSTAFAGDRGKAVEDKLATIANGAEVNVLADWTENDTTKDSFIQHKPTIPTKTSQLTNDSNFITDADIPEGAAASNTTPKEATDGGNKGTENTFARGDHRHPHDSAKQNVIDSNNKLDASLVDDTESTNKFVTASEKSTWNSKLNAINDLQAIRTGATAGATAVQPNDLATVATSGDYEDLTNKPTIPAALIQSDWNQTTTTSKDYIKNKPTIPTKTSELTNDSNFITSADIPEGAAASSTIPLMDGVASVGSETRFARGDHKHPSDTSKANASDLETLFDDIKYIPQVSKLIFYHGNTALKELDCSAFLKDGMIDTVEVKNAVVGGEIVKCVVFTFNADASKSPIVIPVSDIINAANLATVATSGSYSDLSNKPTIPSKTSELTNDSNYITSVPVSSVAGKTGAVILTSSDVGLGNVENFKAVSTVASQGLTDTEKSNARTNIGAGTSSFSGSYNDLTNKPTIPCADKSYEPLAHSGLGRKTLQLKPDGSNILTEEDFDEENTIYVIQYDFDLNDETIEIPVGCVLDFDGGSLDNGTIVGNNTIINADPYQIFGDSIIISGNFVCDVAYPEWFGAKGDGDTNDTEAIKKVLNYFRGHTILFSDDKVYTGDSYIPVYSNTEIVIDGTIISTNKLQVNSGISFEFYDRVTSTPGYSGVHDVVIRGHGTIDPLGNIVKGQATPLRIHHCKNITIKDITCKGSYMWHFIESGGTDGLLIDNVTFYSGYSDSNEVGDVIQLEVIDSGSTEGAIPYDSTVTKNVTIQNCKYIVNDNSPEISTFIGCHPNNAIYNINIINCECFGNRNLPESHCIDFRGSAHDVKIANCRFIDFYNREPVRLGWISTEGENWDCYNFVIENCKFINSPAISIQRSDGIYISNNTIIQDDNSWDGHEWDAGRVYQAIFLRAVSNITICGNTFSPIKQGICIRTDYEDCSNIIITQNVAKVISSEFVRFSRNENYKVYNITITNNVISEYGLINSEEAPGPAIFFTEDLQCENILISDNVFEVSSDKQRLPLHVPFVSKDNIKAITIDKNVVKVTGNITEQAKSYLLENITRFKNDNDTVFFLSNIEEDIDLSNYYTKEETDLKVAGVSQYTEEELRDFESIIEGNISAAASQAIGQAVSQSNQNTSQRLTSYYTKTEVNQIITNTPETNVIVVNVPSDQDIATYLDTHVPAQRDNKVYRVPGPTGNTFSEWAWDGSAFILLAVRGFSISGEEMRAFQTSYKLITRNVQNSIVGLLSSDGEVLTEQTLYRTSDYIKVNKWTRLFGFNVFPKGTYNGICLYDANKQFIAGLPENDEGIGKIPEAEQNVIDTDLSVFPDVCYLRYSSIVTSDGGMTRLYISTPNDDIIDYTSEDKYFATILGFVGSTLALEENTIGNYRTPLIRVKSGDILTFTGTYNNYNQLPAVVGYSDENCNNPVPIITKNGKLSDFVFKVPDGVNYIVGWGERGAVGTGNNNVNMPCFVRKCINNITITVNKTGGTSCSSTSLLEGILMATSGFDNTVIVEAGTYDLISEFESYYGSDFFTNYNNSIKGIYLKNRVNVVFSSGAKVTCHYTGNNTSVQQSFSPFNSDINGFTINNLHLRCSRVRYCIHDERASSTDSYENTYINCDMQIDNTNNSVWHSSNTIGGGLGKHGNIKVLNCIFETIDPQVYSDFGTVSWHNCVLANAKSKIVISGNYLKGETGRIRISWYGESALITTALITNNSMGGSIVHRAENGNFDIHNTEIIEWNNIIRN